MREPARNQCAGCQAGVPVEERPGGYRVHVDRPAEFFAGGGVGAALALRQECTRDRYVSEPR